MNSIAKQFNTNISGNGPQPMMFAHGLGCDQTMWKYVTPAFEDDYKVILFDYAGSGNSSMVAYDKRKYNDLQTYANDIISIAEAHNLSNIVFLAIQ